jgi:hypothetical protein
VQAMAEHMQVGLAPRDEGLGTKARRPPGANPTARWGYSARLRHPRRPPETAARGRPARNARRANYLASTNNRGQISQHG